MLIITAFLNKKINEQYKKNFPYYKLGMLIYIYCSAFIYSLFLTIFLNFFLDFSKGKEIIVSIEEIQSDELTTNPQIYELDKLIVTKNVYNQINKGDRLKLTIKNGFCGIKYISKNIKIYKPNTVDFPSISVLDEEKEYNPKSKTNIKSNIPLLNQVGKPKMN